MSRPVKAAALFKLTASSLIITTLLGGCKPATMAERPHSAGSTSGASLTERLASKVAAEAAQAMAAADHDRAMMLAERVVAVAPADAGYRTLLAQIYLRAGRFVSADQAFADVIQLMPGNDKARVAQAVAKIGHGDRSGALAVLAQVTNAPADDYGLALALAGDAAKAVAVLEPAARGMRGTSRTRQNLALAYALAGQWDKARAVAAQDVSPSEIDRRMENWARLASPEARDIQVASLLGTTRVVGDPGQPSVLALLKPEVRVLEEIAAAEPVVPEPVATSPVVIDQGGDTIPNAIAAVAPVQEIASAAPVAVAAPSVSDVRQAAVDIAVAEVTAPAPAPAPDALAGAVAAEADRAITSAEPTITTALSTTTRVAFKPAPPRKAVQPRGKWVVQLGAYRDQQRVEAGWIHLSDNFQRLAQYTPSQSIYTVTATGAVFYRLSVAGFASHASAASLCRSIKATGGSCFVRRDSNDTPVQAVPPDRERIAALY